jgi:hypothetical protein
MLMAIMRLIIIPTMKTSNKDNPIIERTKMSNKEVKITEITNILSLVGIFS